MVIRFTLHEHLGGLFYARSLVDSIQEFYLQAFDGERLVHTSIIGPEDFLVPLKPKIFDSGISAHTEYAKIRSQAIKERRRFVDFFNYFLLTL